MTEVADSPWARSTTGVPSAREVLLGGGKAYVWTLDDDGEEDGTGARDCGNIPEFALNPSVEMVEHYSTAGGKKVLDKKTPIQEKFDVDFGLENAVEENLALWASSEPAAYTNASVAGFSEYQWIDAVTLGRYYQLCDSTGQPAMGLALTDLNLEKHGSPDVTLDSADFTLDQSTGLVFFKKTATHLAAADAVDATLTANASALTTRRIGVQTTESISVKLMFVGVDPDTGLKYGFVIPKITLSPKGSLNLVTANEWLRMGFTGAAEKKDADTPVAYFISMPEGGVT